MTNQLCKTEIGAVAGYLLLLLMLLSYFMNALMLVRRNLATIHSELSTSLTLRNSTADGIRHRVEVLHNERQVILPKCPTNEIFCPLSELVRGYKQELNCSYEALCGVPWGK